MNDNINKTIGETITRLRTERGIVSQNMFSEIVGVSQSTIREIEQGTRSTTIETLVKICEPLNISLVELLIEATGGMGDKLLIDGLNPKFKEVVRAVANTVKNIQESPPDVQAESNGLTNLGKDVGKIRFKKEKMKQKEA